MKVGDLVKYKPYPHRELGHLVGIVMSFNYEYNDDHEDLNVVWVMWGDRPQGPAGSVLEEWVDELEVISENR